MSTKTKRQRKRLFWLLPAALIALPLAIVFLVGQFTPVLSVWIFKHAIDSTRFTPPSNYTEIEANVAVVSDIVYDGQDTLLDIYYPKGHPGPLPVIMWIHGGGFIGASKEQVKDYAMTMADAGYVVANINYDLAPGQKYPGPVIQANKALMYLRENISQYGGDINQLYLASNSSGSQIASQLAAVISNPEFAKIMDIQPALTNEQLKGVILYDGAYDMQTVSKARGFVGALLPVELWAYTGAKHFESFPRIGELSTIDHVTPDYPPTFLAVGDSDPLEPQSIAFKEELEKNHVDVEGVFYTGTGTHLDHDYMMNLDTQPAQKTLQLALDFLRRHS